MANVDLCVRYSEKALTGNELKKYSSLIYNLPNEEKLHLFRSKTEEQIEALLYDSKRIIKERINEIFYDSLMNYEDIKLEESSNDNKVGADLFHILENNEKIEIEVKYGGSTDKNIGMKSFEQIFGTSIYTVSLNPKVRKEWFNHFQKTLSEEQQYKLLFSKLNEATDIFNDHIKKKNYLLTPDEQKFMENLIINNSGDSLTTAEHYLRFDIKGEGLENIDNYRTGIGRWHIEKVKKIDGDIIRTNVFIRNFESSLMIKFVLNWKNNYKHEGNSYPAKLGFGSPNWNVWITIDIVQI